MISPVMAPRSVLKPNMEDFFKLNPRDHMGAGKVHTDLAQADNIIFVGEDEHREGVISIQHNITRVEIFQKLGEYTHA